MNNKIDAICNRKRHEAIKYLCGEFGGEDRLPKQIIEAIFDTCFRDEEEQYVTKKFSLAKCKAAMTLQQILDNKDIEMTIEPEEETVEMEIVNEGVVD